MLRIPMKDAADQLDELMQNARQGETVIIVDEQNNAVQLVPVESKARLRKAGSAKGQIRFAESFDDPIADFDDYRA